jgi:hypothetical protein
MHSGHIGISHIGKQGGLSLSLNWRLFKGFVTYSDRIELLLCEGGISQAGHRGWVNIRSPERKQSGLWRICYAALREHIGHIFKALRF